MKTLLKTTAICGMLAMVTACGVTYTSPKVKEAASEAAVRVMDITPQSVRVANSQPYTPKSLPAVFYQATGYGSGIASAGAVPPAPYIPDESRGQLELRVPPQLPAQPYRIGVGDVVLLATKQAGNTVEQLTGLLAASNQRQGYTVRDDGAITIPDIGTVPLAGLTLEEAEARVFEALLDNQIDPAFSLEVSEFNSQKIAVGGAVGNSTIVPVTLSTPRLGEVLAAAGGVQVQDEEFASIRIYRDGTLYQIPLEEFYGQPDLQKIRLTDGDAVFVDTTYDLDRALQFYQARIDVIQVRSQARSDAMSALQSEISIRRAAIDEARNNYRDQVSFDAVERDYVYLTGEVAKQSRVTLPLGRNATLADVLYDSGGFDTTTGDPAQIYVLRASDNPAEFGAVTAWHLDAANIVNMTMATKFEMRPNDIVFIEEQPITKWGRALQQAFPILLGQAGNAITD